MNRAELDADPRRHAKTDRSRPSPPCVAGDAVAGDPDHTEHVVDRARLLLLLLRHQLLSDAGTRPTCASTAACQIVALGFWGSIPLRRRHAGRRRRRLAVRHDSQATRQRQARPPRCGSARVSCSQGAFVVPAAMVERHDDSPSCCLATSFFFLEWVIGPAWAVPMDVGGRFSGTVTGVMNMAGALAASLTPIVYGSLFGRRLLGGAFRRQCSGTGAGSLDLDLSHRSGKACCQRGCDRLMAGRIYDGVVHTSSFSLLGSCSGSP